MAVDPRAGCARLQRLADLRQQCAGDSRKDVAAAGGGENWRARGAHEGDAPRRRDHRRDPLEQHRRTSALRELGADLEAPVEYFTNGGPGQSGELRRMRREERRAAAERAPQGVDVAVEDVERVRIEEHGTTKACEHAIDERPRVAAAPEPRTDDDTVSP